jgi:hypothetical protein
MKNSSKTRIDDAVRCCNLFRSKDTIPARFASFAKPNKYRALQKSGYNNMFKITLKPGSSSKPVNLLKNWSLRERPAKNGSKPGFCWIWFMKVWTNVVNRVCKDLKPAIDWS